MWTGLEEGPLNLEGSSNSPSNVISENDREVVSFRGMPAFLTVLRVALHVRINLTLELANVYKYRNEIRLYLLTCTGYLVI